MEKSEAEVSRQMDFLTEYGLFLAKAATIVAALLLVVAGSVALSARARTKARDGLEVKHLNAHYRHMQHALRSAFVPRRALRKLSRQDRKLGKPRHGKQGTSRNRVFVLNFQGNILATAVASLREEITAVLTVATPQDEVLVRLESSGGLVHAYGLAASQLQRIKQRKIPLTVAVDKVAASGGYMMACVADRLLAAPFAVLGSIGVVSQLPNFHRLLKKNDIDFEQITAGEYKRTLTLFGETTDRAREKVREEVEQAHGLFKDFVAEHRPRLDIAAVSTGEYWYGRQALDLKLVDELRTSDDYLLEASETAEVYEVNYVRKKTGMQRLLGQVSALRRLGFSDPALRALADPIET